MEGQHMTYVFQHAFKILSPTTEHNVEIMKKLVPVGSPIAQLLHQHGRRKRQNYCMRQHSPKTALRQSLIERAVKQDLNNCNTSKDKLK